MQQRLKEHIYSFDKYYRSSQHTQLIDCKQHKDLIILFPVNSVVVYSHFVVFANVSKYVDLYIFTQIHDIQKSSQEVETL